MTTPRASPSKGLVLSAKPKNKLSMKTPKGRIGKNDGLKRMAGRIPTLKEGGAA